MLDRREHIGRRTTDCIALQLQCDKGESIFMLKLDMKAKVILVLRLISCTVCLYLALGGTNPPTFAQSKISVPASVATQLALHDQSIDQLQEFKEKQEQQNKIVSDYMAEQTGEIRVIGAFLALLNGGHLLVSLKKSKV